MVAAGVGRSGVRIGVGMLIDYERVQLTDNGYPGTGACPARHPAFNARESQGVPVLDAQFIKLAGHQPGSPGLAEARLRMGQDLLGDTNQLLLALFNGGTSFLLELLLG